MTAAQSTCNFESRRQREQVKRVRASQVKAWYGREVRAFCKPCINGICPRQCAKEGCSCAPLL